jgi:hypothetical protein
MKIIGTFIIGLSLMIIPALSLGSNTVFADNVFSNCGSGSAAGTPDVCNQVAAQQKDQNTDPIITIIKTTIDVISTIVGAASVITIIVSGIRYVTSGGSSDATASARKGLAYALIGILVTVLAQVFVAYILNQ